MECSKCQVENRDGAKFCVECGNKLAPECSKCNHINPPGSKFCEECGSKMGQPTVDSIKDPSLDEKIVKIQKYLPKGIAQKILAQKEKIEGERKQVTVMFCDMVGFTPLIEKLGSEQGYAIMDQVYEILIHKVHDYDGTVNEMTGDGIMALFGAPIALEDAPQRAIRSSLAIHREIAKFGEKIDLSRKSLPNIKMRIGINTGTVVVGSLGNDLRVEFKAVGNTVNLASRVEGMANPGTTYITEDTFKLVEGLFRFEALGKQQIKGKDKPIDVYWVIAPSTRRTRFDVSAERGLAPFVGRNRELELLIDGYERVKLGRGQAFSIVSEAGVGKSRLLYELRKSLVSEDVMFLEGRCLSYSNGVAYHPIIDIIKANLDIREDDGDSVIRDKVEKGLNILGIDEAYSTPIVLELLSVKESGIDDMLMSPDAKKERIMEVIRLFTLKGSAIRPLVTAYEDLHWADKSSEEALKYVLESIPAARVLMIFTYRPDFVHTWGGKSYHNQINLNRLPNRETLAMVSNLLSTDKLDIELEELILEKSEGVPLFIEEFVRSLKDLKIIEEKDKRYRLKENIKKLTIPSTIQGVIMARVDSLPESAKELLQTGSVIEREFSYELIRLVTGLQEKQLLSNLSVLKDSELLFERGIYPESNYIFKHALTRDVVYDSILTGNKRKLHVKIGDAVESLYSDRIEEQYELLAHHYGYAESWEKAVHFGRLAAEKSHRLSQFQHASTLYSRARDWLIKLPKSRSVQEQLVDIQLDCCWSNIGLGRFDKAEQVGLQAEDIAKTLDDPARLGITFLGLATAYVYSGNFTKTEHYSLKAIEYLEKTNENRALAIANQVLGSCYIGQGFWQKSEPRFLAAVSTYEKLGRKTEYVMGWNALPYTIVCGQLGYNLGVIGRVSDAKDLFKDGYTSELEPVCNLTTKMAYCSWQGLFISLIGEDPFGSATKIDRLVELAERSDSPFLILVFCVAKANILLGIEKYDMALTTCKKALNAIEGKAIRTGHVINLFYDLVLSEIKAGDLQSAWQHYKEGLPLVDLAPHWWEPRFDFLKGLLTMTGDNYDYNQAEACFDRSITADERVGAVVPAAQTCYHKAHNTGLKGEKAQSFEMLKELSEQFRTWDIQAWHKKCLKTLDEYAE